jgi:hypothetical protein
MGRGKIEQKRDLHGKSVKKLSLPLAIAASSQTTIPANCMMGRIGFPGEHAAIS